MKFLNVLFVAYTILHLSGCGTAAPASAKRLVQHPELSGREGALLIVDVCLNESPLVAQDYFVVSNSRETALAVSSVAENYLAAAGLTNILTMVPFVCGAAHDVGGAPKRVANSIDGEVGFQRQPFGVSDEMLRDPDYLSALTILSTHIAQGALAASTPDQPKDPRGSFVSHQQATAAAQLIRERSNRPTVIYVSIAGTSFSAEKAIALGATRGAIGAVVSVAIGPIFKAAGTGYYVVFVPSGISDSSQSIGALFDLQSATLVKSNIINTAGDPMKVENLVHRDAIRLLLRDMVFSNRVN